MKRIALEFLRIITILVGIGTLFSLAWLPLTEGRAQHLDVPNIYLDPFILYIYTASIVFFVALYKVFKLLGYIYKDELYSLKSLRTLRGVKLCAAILGILIVTAGVYIAIYHHKDDDPAGFLGMCAILTLLAIVVTIATGILQKKLRTAVQTHNDATN